MRLFASLAIGIATAVVTVLVSGIIVVATVPLPSGSDIHEEESSGKSWILSTLSLFPPARSERSLFAVMIENQEDARPFQEGLGDALLIEEMIVEGGISRFAVLFDATDLPESVGPVRSLRPYFVSAALPYVHTVIHAGGSPEAFEKAKLHSRSLRAINLLSYDGGKADYRRDDIPAPHNMFMNKEQIEMILSGATAPIAWPLFDEGSLTGQFEEATNIEIDFFSRLHDVFFAFEKTSQRYVRTNGDNVSDAKPANVLVLESPITGVGEFGRLTIPLTGRGNALLFRNGRVARIKWEKRTDESRFRLTDADGKGIRLAKGQTWLTVLPSLERVTWK